ncbi:MAG: hypothetical protein WC029_14345 [Sulfuricella sp.]|jgi:hypothetical protein
MRTIKLKTTSEDGTSSEELALQFDDEDLQLLEHYLANCDRLKEARIFTGEFPRVKNINCSAETGITFEVSSFSYGDVCELLHLARPVFLSREPASFELTAAIFGKKAKGTALAQHLKHIRSTYEHGDYQPYFQVSVNGVPLFHDKTLRDWLNGVEYHQEVDKAQKIKDLESALSTQIARGIFVSQLSGRVRAAFMLAHLATLVARPDTAEKSIEVRNNARDLQC